MGQLLIDNLHLHTRVHDVAITVFKITGQIFTYFIRLSYIMELLQGERIQQ